MADTFNIVADLVPSAFTTVESCQPQLRKTRISPLLTPYRSTTLNADFAELRGKAPRAGGNVFKV
ncbi:hypothetical protein K443DRAFT_10063 [Laccaria amethystina LaAM-08-1]|uniref:Uncharacterized protein n=1 Tax=Laccaria amethystina LaAM-08-1 TaxID=1095629 RepID=A0A0C9XHT1_9AGAR|nr:hypothetical protein K443DRAFT_10063 [Laccaria amethystina LaAM-08-1]